AYNNRGIAKFILGRHMEAIEDFLKAKKLKSKR
ncbi:tetratricopeptide repeat protein, partial [Candidatus Pacearchaeota archaeon]|nr:tetratricopeptide repeat protein [Candidatus Pacearchaeota archaeon]